MTVPYSSQLPQSIGQLNNVEIDTGTLANDDIIKYSTASNTWVNAVASGGGKVLNAVGVVNATAASNNTVTYIASNLTATITPSSATSKVLVMMSSNGRIDDLGSMTYTLYQDIGGAGGVDLAPTSNGFGKIAHGQAGMRLDTPIGLVHLASPATTAAVVYTIYFKAEAAGRTGECPPYNGLSQNMILLEIGA